jgi:hypothetical protein
MPPTEREPKKSISDKGFFTENPVQTSHAPPTVTSSLNDALDWVDKCEPKIATQLTLMSPEFDMSFETDSRPPQHASRLFAVENDDPKVHGPPTLID